MKFTRLHIPDVILIEPDIFSDARGFFYESYRKSVFENQGIAEDFIQDNHVRSARGVLRGMHYQLEPFAQAKLVRCVRGRIFDAAIDIREGSPTFGKHIGVELDAVSRKMLYVPKGFAHGYLALEEDSEVVYKVSNIYSRESERGILWCDPEVGIKWPKLDVPYRFSDKDPKYPSLKTADHF